MADDNELDDRVVYINRVSKAISGGSTFTFSTMVAVGDHDGRVGIGVGQATEVAPSIHKGKADAKKHIKKIPRLNTTVPHEIEAQYDSAHVLLKPAVPGTGVIAGGAVRSVVELAGIQDILSKSLGSDNPLNIARATMKAFREMRDPHRLANLRGISVEKLLSNNPYGGPDKYDPDADEEDVEETAEEAEQAAEEEAEEVAEETPEADAAEEQTEESDEEQEVTAVETS